MSDKQVRKVSAIRFNDKEKDLVKIGAKAEDRSFSSFVRISAIKRTQKLIKNAPYVRQLT